MSQVTEAVPYTANQTVAADESGRPGRSPRILCVSPAFPPLADSESFCGGKMVEALSGCGALVHVITSSNIVRGRLDDSPLWKMLENRVTDVPVPSRRDLFGSIRGAVRYQSYWARWVGAVVLEASRRHKQLGFDLVYSRSLPMIAHVAGYWISRHLGCRWIANINDPWDYHLFPQRNKQRTTSWGDLSSRSWLKRTLRSADLVTYPSHRLWNFHEKLAGFRHHAEIISHIGCRAQQDANLHGNKFHIVHAGKLGMRELSGRSTTHFLTGLKDFLKEHPEACSEVRVTLVGPKDAATHDLVEQFGMQAVVQSVGPVSYERSLEYIASAAVCLLVETTMDEGIYFPSKLADYVAAGKPVLALSPSVGVIADMAAEGRFLRVNPDDPGAIKSGIAALYSHYKNGTLELQSPMPSLIEQVSPMGVGRRFLALASTRNWISSDMRNHAVAREL